MAEKGGNYAHQGADVVHNASNGADDDGVDRGAGEVTATRPASTLLPKVIRS